MAEQLNLKAAGLYLDANNLSEAPAGAMSVAQDVVISRPGVIESRRGFNRYLADAPDALVAMANFGGQLVGAGSTGGLFRWTGSAWASYSGSYSAPSGTGVRVRFEQASGNLYFTTTAGAYRLDSVTGTPAVAGAPRALDPTLATANTGTGLWLTNGNQAGYYVTWSLTDANNNTHEGAPSGRVVFANSGTTPCTVNVTIPILSSEMTTAHVFRVYRTAQYASGTDPGAEAQLIYQRNPTSAEVAAKTLTFEDVVPDALRGATAYFAPSQEGAVSGNEPPPLAKDLCLFRGTMFYANTTGRQSLQLSLLSVGGTAGLQNGDVVTVCGVAFNAKTTPSAATDFLVTTSGTVSQNIEATARALIAAINKYAASTGFSTQLGAYYFSGELDPPGKILLQERGVGGSAFSVTASAHGTAWSPQLPTSGATVSSAADVKKNRLAWSKYQQPEAVPLLNYVDVGSGTAAIQRILALRDSLVILKEDGAFRLTGDAGAFRVDLLDPTAVLFAPRTAVVLNNRVFGWFTQGVLAISDTGAESISYGRVDGALRVYVEMRSSQGDLAFGVASDVTHHYALVASNQHLVAASNAIVYNNYSDAWVSWAPLGLEITGGGTLSNGSMVLGDNGKGVYAEHFLDAFADLPPDNVCADTRNTSTITITSITDNQHVTVSNASGAQIGDILWQGDSSTYGTIQAVSGNNITVTAPGDRWTTTACNILKPLSVQVAYLPATAGTAYAKQFTEAALLFEQTPPTSLGVTFSTDLGTSATVTLAPGLSSNPGELWTWVPPECQRCGRLTLSLTHSVAGERLRLLGVSLKARIYGERRFGR